MRSLVVMVATLVAVAGPTLAEEGLLPCAETANAGLFGRKGRRTRNETEDPSLQVHGNRRHEGRQDQPNNLHRTRADQERRDLESVQARDHFGHQERADRPAATPCEREGTEGRNQLHWPSRMPTHGVPP